MCVMVSAETVVRLELLASSNLGFGIGPCIKNIIHLHSSGYEWIINEIFYFIIISYLGDL